MRGKAIRKWLFREVFTLVTAALASGAIFCSRVEGQADSPRQLFDELTRQLLEDNRADDRMLLMERIVGLDVPFRSKLDALVAAMEREYELTEEFEYGPGPTPYSVATDALGRTGPASLPALESCLRDASNDLVRYVCMCAISDIGSRASFASELEQFVRQSALWDSKGIVGVGDCAGRALSSIGEESVPHLLSLAGDKDSFVETIAIMELARLGPAAADALPVLVQKMLDKKRHKRLLLIDAIGEIGPGARDALPVLQELLDSEKSKTVSAGQEHMRRRTVTALEEALSRIRQKP